MKNKLFEILERGFYIWVGLMSLLPGSMFIFLDDLEEDKYRKSMAKKFKENEKSSCFDETFMIF